MMHKFLTCFLLIVLTHTTSAGDTRPCCSGGSSLLCNRDAPLCVCSGDGIPTTFCNSPCTECTGQVSSCFECACPGDGVIERCSRPEECCSRRRTLREEADHKFEGGELEYKELAESCRDFDYNIFLYVDTHFYGLASPKEQAVDAGCPFVAVHNHMIDGKLGNKQLLAWYDKENGESAFPDESFSIGTFKASALIEAFENADDQESGPYDVFSNSCATFIVNLAHELGVQIDMPIKSFAARRLMEEKGNDLIEQIKNSANYFSFLGSRNLDANGVSDEEIVEMVVERHVGGA